MSLQVRNSDGVLGSWFCAACNSYTLPVFMKDGKHEFCSKPVEFCPGEVIEYGYVHIPGEYVGKWHIIADEALSEHMLCDLRLVSVHMPGIHMDYTEPESEDDICKHCVQVKSGARRLHPNAGTFLVETHWYQCRAKAPSANGYWVRCKKLFLYDGNLNSVPCPREHTERGFWYRHMCCGGVPEKPRRPWRPLVPVGRDVTSGT